MVSEGADSPSQGKHEPLPLAPEPGRVILNDPGEPPIFIEDESNLLPPGPPCTKDPLDSETPGPDAPPPALSHPMPGKMSEKGLRSSAIVKKELRFDIPPEQLKQALPKAGEVLWNLLPEASPPAKRPSSKGMSKGKGKAKGSGKGKIYSG